MVAAILRYHDIPKMYSFISLTLTISIYHVQILKICHGYDESLSDGRGM